MESRPRVKTKQWEKNVGFYRFKRWLKGGEVRCVGGGSNYVHEVLKVKYNL